MKRHMSVNLVYDIKPGRRFYHSTGMPKRAEQNFIISIVKSVAVVTNNKRLRLRYYTVETNYRHTRSIPQPLCDSRASCDRSLQSVLCGLLEEWTVRRALQSSAYRVQRLLCSRFLITPSTDSWKGLYIFRAQ